MGSGVGLGWGMGCVVLGCRGGQVGRCHGWRAVVGVCVAQNGRTPLHAACQAMCSSLVSMLLVAGADVEARDSVSGQLGWGVVGVGEVWGLWLVRGAGPWVCGRLCCGRGMVSQGGRRPDEVQDRWPGVNRLVARHRQQLAGSGSPGGVPMSPAAAAASPAPPADADVATPDTAVAPPAPAVAPLSTKARAKVESKRQRLLESLRKAATASLDLDAQVADKCEEWHQAEPGRGTLRGVYNVEPAGVVK